MTPSLSSETILPGVTRQSILELAAAECGLTVVEGRIPIHDLPHATEAFFCGTGACITPVGCISITSTSEEGEERCRDVIFGDGTSPGPMTQKLYTMLTDIFSGSNAELAEKYRDWIHVVEP